MKCSLFTIARWIRSRRAAQVTGLAPGTTYHATLEACTGGGCANCSASAPFTTPESASSGLVPPTLAALNSTVLLALWPPPAALDGALTNASLLLLTLDASGSPGVARVVYSTSVLQQCYSVAIGRLLPFTVYSFTALFCTAAGCATSAFVSVRTANAQRRDDSRVARERYIDGRLAQLERTRAAQRHRDLLASSGGPTICKS